MAQAMVELTSPTTTMRSGRSRRQMASNATITRAVCSACEPEPTSSRKSGAARPRSAKKTSDMDRS